MSTEHTDSRDAMRGVATTFALDTDIGTDVDDLLAVAMILGSGEAAVPLITTVYGDAALRARIAAAAFAAAGRPAPRIVAGRRETLSGREVWWPGHEGETIPDLDGYSAGAEGDAVAELAASPRIAAIAPLTNIALAVESEQSEISQIVLMGGEFVQGVVEHNIRCDVDAAQRVFRSGVPVIAVGLDQTERVRLNREDLQAIGVAGPLGALVAKEMARFWEFASQDYNVPHDPLAVLVLIRPDLFDLRRGTIAVDADGLTVFTASEDGPHRIVVDMDVEAAAHEIRSRILTGVAAIATA